MASMIPPHRRSTRPRRAPERFNPDASKWVPGSANGSNSPIKIDHWQLRFNGQSGESQGEKKSDNNYENAIDWRLKNDKEAAKDRQFVVSDNVTIRCKRTFTDSDSESEFEFTDFSDDEDFESACSWMSDESDEDDDVDDSPVKIRDLPTRLREFTEDELELEKRENQVHGI